MILWNPNNLFSVFCPVLGVYYVYFYLHSHKFIHLLNASLRRAETTSSTESYAEALKSLDNLLRNYDKRLLPKPKFAPVKQSDTGGAIKNVKVEVNMYIRSFTEVDEINHVSIRLTLTK